MSETETTATKTATAAAATTTTDVATEKSRKPSNTQRFSSVSPRHVIAHHKGHGKFVYQKLRLRQNQSCTEDGMKCRKIKYHDEQVSLDAFPQYVQKLFLAPKNDAAPESLNKAISESTNVTVSQPTNVTVSEPTNVTVSEPRNVTVSEPTNVTVSEPTNKTVSESTNVTVSQLTNKTVSESTNVTVSEPTNKTVSESANVTVSEPTNKTVSESTNVTVFEFTNKTVSESTNVTVSELTNNTVSKSTNVTVSESTNKTVSESKNNFCPDQRFSEVLQGDDIKKLVTVLWHLTGKVETNAEVYNTPTEEKEEFNTFGTCFIERVEKITDWSCPCCFCQAPGEPKKEWGLITASTALHVIQDEISNIIGRWVRLDYDVDDKETAAKDKSKKEEDRKYLPIWKVHSEDEEGDWCAVEFITHDLKKVDALEELINKHYEIGNKLNKKWGTEPDDNLPIILISHPHGLAKRISVGKVQAKSIIREVRDEQDFCHFDYCAATCPGSSGGAVYVLGKQQDGFGYWFGHIHGHMGAYDDMLCESSDGVVSTSIPQ